MTCAVLIDDPTVFAVRIDAVGRCRHLSLSGQLDVISAPLFEDRVWDAFASPDVTAVTLDLSDVTYLGAAGLRSLALAQQMARDSERELHVHCGSRRAVLRPLQITGVLGR